MSSDAHSENGDEKRADAHGEKAVVTSTWQVDTGAELVAGVLPPLDPIEAQRIR